MYGREKQLCIIVIQPAKGSTYVHEICVSVWTECFENASMGGT